MSFAEQCRLIISFWRIGTKSILKSTTSFQRTSLLRRLLTRFKISKHCPHILAMYVLDLSQFSTLLFTGSLNFLKFRNHWRLFWIILVVSTSFMIGKSHLKFST